MSGGEWTVGMIGTIAFFAGGIIGILLDEWRKRKRRVNMAIKDFTIEHAAHCDYCIEIKEREDLSDEEKWRLQEQHAFSSVGQ